MKFEISERDGLGRTGILELDGIKVRTPVVAFVDSERHPAPHGALRLRLEWSAGRGDFVIGASYFSTGPRRSGEHANVHPGYRGSPYAKEVVNDDFAILRNPSEMLLDSGKYVAGLTDLKAGEELLKPALCSVMGTPQRLAFLVYCGFDVFDSIPLIMSAENGWYLTSTDRLEYDRLEELPCSCPACSSGRKGKDELLQHNYNTAINELRLARHAISEGTLRELVESRVRSEPWMVQNLRLLDLEHYGFLEMHTPIKGSRFHAGSRESLTRPDVLRWRKRLEGRYRRPQDARILLLIPCSAKKPYSLSQSHMRFRQAIWESGMGAIVHEVIVTSPLGLVPRELELFYPAQDYDIPVTGHWDREEKRMVEEMVSWLVESQRYDLVISHLGDEREPVNSVLRDFVDTSLGSPGSRESLERLTEAIKGGSTDPKGASKGHRVMDDMRSICRFQFGQAGEGLCDAGAITGRWPNLRIVGEKGQVGMLTGERGMVSLTLEGGALLAENGAYCVEIEDFMPKGNLFAVGVTRASEDIRIGDDVAVVNDREVRAVGVARMTPIEMGLAERGEAVRIRHALERPV